MFCFSFMLFSQLYLVTYFNFSDSPYHLATLLETNEAIAEFYNCLKCPKEVRLYSREMLILTQKFLLPVRCCTYLTYLSQADLFSKKFDDCRVKLKGMADILRFTNEVPHVHNLVHDSELESVVQDLENMHIGNAGGNKVQMSTSPIFPRENVKYPEFYYHEKTCLCFFCSSFEYQNLVMKKVRLEAMLNLKENNLETAKNLFDNGINLYHYTLQKFKLYMEDVDKKFHSALAPYSANDTIQLYGKLLFDLTKFLMKFNKKTLAADVNEKLLKILEPWKSKYMHFYNDVLLQKVAILTDEPKLVVCLPLPEDTTGEIMKTPEQKVSSVSVTVQKTSPCSPIFKFPLKKRLQFETSPENNNNKKQESSDASKQTPRGKETSSNKRGTSTSKKGHSKTPAPKIKIYTEEESKNDPGKRGGRITRAKAATQKVTDIFEDDLPQTSQLKNVRRTYSSRKILLGELERQSAKK